MPLLSARTLILTLSTFHLTAAYYLLTSPTTIADQNLVFILGAAMDLPTPTSTFSTPSAPLSLLSSVLSLFALSDLVAAHLPSGEIFAAYWGAQARARLAFFFVLTGYAFLRKPGTGTGAGMEMGDGLKNSVVFTWGFVEVVTWFWIYITLRDERRELAVKLAQRRNAMGETDEDRL